MSRNVTARIYRYNRGRDEQLLKRKFERTRAEPFRFFMRQLPPVFREG